MILNAIDFDGAERKICRNCVNNLRDQGKPETLKKAEYNTVYGADESVEGEEEVKGCLTSHAGLLKCERAV